MTRGFLTLIQREASRSVAGTPYQVEQLWETARPASGSGYSVSWFAGAKSNSDHASRIPNESACKGDTDDMRFESPDNLAVSMPEDTVFGRGRAVKPRW